MSLLLAAMPGNEAKGRLLAERVGAETAALTMRRFPDGESYIRLDSECADRDVILFATLERPGAMILQLLFLADLVRELGARRVVLVAPYLAYMRQDKRFQPGEAVTSRSFARLLSDRIDVLVTVDPHLHRYHQLKELYAACTRVVHAAPLLAEWIAKNVAQPLLVGPDEESAQWVAMVAREAGAPYIVLEKTRHGDRDVTVSVPDVHRWAELQPVLLDDIISTARTMIETTQHLVAAGLQGPVCVGVHAIFANHALAELQAAGVRSVVTTNTITHPTNMIDISNLLADSVLEVLA